jgi:hypothetical protein
MRQMGNSVNHPTDGDCMQGYSLQLILPALHLFVHNMQINNSEMKTEVMTVEKFCNRGRRVLRFNPWRVCMILQCQVVSYIFFKLKKIVKRYRCIGTQFWYHAPDSQGLQEWTYAEHLKQMPDKGKVLRHCFCIVFKIFRSRAATITTNNRSKVHSSVLCC